MRTVALTLVLLAAAPAAAADPLPACCWVYGTSPADGGTHCGAATCVAREGDFSLLVTCRHVWESVGSAPTVYYWRGDKKYKVAASRHAAVDRRIELGLFLVQLPLPAVDLAPEDPRPGATLQFFGFRRVGGKGTVLDRFTPDTEVASVTADFTNQHGDSGSGVFDAKDRLCGVFWGSVGRPGDGDAAFMPVSEVRAFLKRSAGPRFPKLLEALGQ